MISNTPSAPYYAVIFTSTLNSDHEGYEETAERMVELAHKETGFLGLETARDKVGITVSYWKDLDSIKAWKANLEHAKAIGRGKAEWYTSFKVRIAKVERDY